MEKTRSDETRSEATATGAKCLQSQIMSYVQLDLDSLHIGLAKNWHHILYTLTSNINFFTVRIGRKFVITLLVKIPPHPKCVATLPYETSVLYKAAIVNKPSVTTNFRKFATENSFLFQLSSKVSATFCSFEINV